MARSRTHLPYRPCVGVVLINRDGLVWMGKRIPKWEGDASEYRWQMPQGGIDQGEGPEQAAFRELEEEIGTAKAEIIGESSRWLTYDLPEEALGIALKGKYRGQTQKWFAMRFLGNDGDVDISERPGHKAEFSEWRWAPMREVVGAVVEFKQPIYRALADEFAALLDEGQSGRD
jgi:putative (di)nucleoside polyphosphate hydrolase